jgi:hypothetical protein
MIRCWPFWLLSDHAKAYLMKTAPPIRSPPGLGMIWDSAYPLSCGARHERGRANNPILTRAWEESRQTCTPCAMRRYTGRNFRTCSTASHISRRSSALRAASNARHAPFSLPHRPGVDNQALGERRTWYMLSDRDRQRQRNLCPRDRVWGNDAQRTCCRAGLLCL